MISPASLGFNLEPTFRCNLTCQMCPRFSSEDPHLDMAWDVFGRIHNEMHLAHSVDFTGWGEPLLHPRLSEMVAMASAKGCITSITSNGTALNSRNAGELAEAGMDRLTVSVDGITAETYEALRPGAKFEKVQDNLKSLSRYVIQTGSRMELGIAFTIQEANALELKGIAEFTDQVGGRVLHLKHLNAVSTREDWERSFLKYRLPPLAVGGDRLKKLEKVIAKVQKRAARFGIKVLIHSEFPMTGEMAGRHCLAAPREAVYFSFDGKVAPCCHLGHTVSRFVSGKFIAPACYFLGDINSQSLDDIWSSPEYVAFRQGFADRRFPEVCRTCYLLYGK
jgi:MoaA/NifB/PqqE/SkfB family radical SAM enzyme